MSPALLDLLSWIAAFVVLFFLFRWLQGRKKRGPSQDEE
jgi:hypothetical protein